ncbi:hypothetical protein [Bacillus spizizenii]|uniref:hypothetical protein n=1 Tax=Bacillus spizizenii TaxID=96241 RepID=UPI002FCA35BE
MRNIEVSLKSDYTKGSGQLFRMYFSFDSEDNEIIITSTEETSGEQHDYALTRDEYIFLRARADEFFSLLDTQKEDE